MFVFVYKNVHRLLLLFFQKKLLLELQMLRQQLLHNADATGVGFGVKKGQMATSMHGGHAKNTESVQRSGSWLLTMQSSTVPVCQVWSLPSSTV